MFCPRCGTQNKERAKFCCSCGVQMIQFVQETEQQMNRPTDTQAPKENMLKNKFYHHPQNEKICKYIQISAKALYMIVFVMYFLHLSYISMMTDVIAVELLLINKQISVGAFKAMLLLFCVAQELLVLFAHIKQNYICAAVLVGTMLLHSLLFGAGIITIIWIPCGAFFAFWLYKLEKSYQSYCQNGEI